MNILDNLPMSLKEQAIIGDDGRILGFNCWLCKQQSNVYRCTLMIEEEGKPARRLDAWICAKCKENNP